jgi:hypothetical protein
MVERMCKEIDAHGRHGYVLARLPKELYCILSLALSKWDRWKRIRVLSLVCFDNLAKPK